MGFGVWGLGFRASGLGFRSFRCNYLRVCRVYGLQGEGLAFIGFGFGASDLGFIPLNPKP